MKAGIKTTEFWITILTIIGSTTASLEKILDPKWAVLIAGLSSVAYTISRALVKNGSDAQISNQQ